MNSEFEKSQNFISFTALGKASKKLRHKEISKFYTNLFSSLEKTTIGHKLLSNWMKRSLVNSNFQLDDGTQKRSFGPYSENWSDWNSKNLTEFSSGNWNFNLKFQSYN